MNRINVPNPESDSFISNINIEQLIEIFDIMPDVLFWIKDDKGRFMYTNTNFLEHMGVDYPNQILGRTDFDFSPAHIANQFKIDDQKVMAGDIIDERLEMNNTKSGEIFWFTTSKRPLLNVHNVAIGTYGTSRHLEKTSIALSGMDALKKPVAYVHKNYMDNISLTELASVTHLSISALERRFKKYLNKTPIQFINGVRLENARRLLVETNLSIATVASDTGFTDHSYFSRQFRCLFGMLPSEFRKEYCEFNG